ncbi:Diguanylate cyclase (GGDEF) domain-containing protein [Paraburkholderia ribeironis]|uniref:diguanylate cyclase n=1 Tax=Paraburkholderia ribeironis TaxID=1247936 RepID=A0A1N7SJA5_9BURK|nr:GGDEF domain-containing protein [Paraburkholderia ribeironis]SIT47511.1 Diguanylate cyclase (GGDEF) domain-containing protein [Paraburkholderia ribeironis]
MSATTAVQTDKPLPFVRFITRSYAQLVLVAFALVPAYLIGYLHFFQNPALKFENHPFHEIAIAGATFEGLFVTYVTWQCYRSSGEPLLRWMTLGFLGFVLIYALHGAFTGLAHQNIWLFLLYGPASRLTMSILLLIGLLSYHRPPDPADRRAGARYLLSWAAILLVVNVLVALLAYSTVAGVVLLRVMEAAALIFSMLNVAILMLRRPRSPLMLVYGISIMSFALSSVAFLLGSPWNHMWWLAHVIFASGFFLLSYGVVQAFLTTRSFATIYSREELNARLAQEMDRTKNALKELHRTNQKLAHLAATDPLTGAANRRHFIACLETEVIRAQRDGTPFSLLALDLDNFKWVNDAYGHQVGDTVLQGFVRACLDAMRPYDGVARVGGEEFMVLLTRTSLDAALAIGERIRAATASTTFAGEIGRKVSITVSIGISQFGRDGRTSDALLRAADQRLYHAKSQGRNRVSTV